MLKKKLLLLLILVSLWPVARFCHHETKGFRLTKLQNNTTCLPNQSSPPLPGELLPLLDQPFTYFGRGLQSFSFLSKDGEVVLKLFNNRYQRKLILLKLLPFKSLTIKKISYLQKKWAETFQSYELASTLLKPYTGLLYFHPQKSSDCPVITVIDRLGIAHQIDLSQVAFALQKKAKSAYCYLSEMAKGGSEQEAKAAFASIVSLLKKRIELGVHDKDPLIRTNLGFLGNEAMYIDLGPFLLENQELQKEEIVKITLSLRHWLEKNAPELLPYFFEALDTL
jgi:hypothetical protein